MRKRMAVALTAGVMVVLGGVFGLAQPMPYNAAESAIDSQQQYQRQAQRLSPRNRLFLSPVGQPQRYDAVTINRYLMGSPESNYRIRPVVSQPMYGR